METYKHYAIKYNSKQHIHIFCMIKKGEGGWIICLNIQFKVLVALPKYPRLKLQTL